MAEPSMVFDQDAASRMMEYAYLSSSFAVKQRFDLPSVDCFSSPYCTGNDFAFDELSVFAASSSDPDLLSYDEAMRSPYSRQFVEAAADEIRSLEAHGTWDVVPQSDAKTRILPGTWAFKLKRTPDGTIKKVKGRFCVRGDMQEGEFDTYAPVVGWTAVRLFLILALTLGWYMCAVDYSNAFVQAILNEAVWVHLPRGFASPIPGAKYCLRLKKSLYGLSVAPRLWHEHLLKALKAEGFSQSIVDPCFLTKKDMMIILYVDDQGIAAKSKDLVDALIHNLQTKHGFTLTYESTFAEFLGIKLEEDPKTGAINMTQRGLIDKIIADTGLEDCNPNWNPTSTDALGADPEGAPMHETWSYRSIVGKLLYLSTNTRPDIAFAVSQVARFAHEPKKSHATAIKTIVRYLARTRDKGTIVRPDGSLRIDCYADADFAGLYRREPDLDPTSAKSRTGFIIKLGGCPLVWKSQLQTAISMSTLEAEYIALSSSVRTLIPTRRLLEETVKRIGLSQELIDSIDCVVHEDNNGALTLARDQRLTNRTKYLHVGWHWFWSFVGHLFRIVKCPTDEQCADYCTKALVRDKFESNRRANQGW
ncbi:MAG: reverse transcriptase domain-containing protein [Gaiellaceae bacterium]